MMWHDAPCFLEMYPVCEKGKVVEPVEPIVPVVKPVVPAVVNEKYYVI
jgi:hypothetical protein